MFISKEEQKLSAEFLNKGYLVQNIKDTNSLSKIYEIVEKYCIKEGRVNKIIAFQTIHSKK